MSVFLFERVEIISSDYRATIWLVNGRMRLQMSLEKVKRDQLAND